MPGLRMRLDVALDEGLAIEVDVLAVDHHLEHRRSRSSRRVECEMQILPAATILSQSALNSAQVLGISVTPALPAWPSCEPTAS